MTEQERTRRNLNPHKSALVAMWIWGADYARQRGGSMDFWDSLSQVRKRVARDLVARMATAPEEAKRG